VLAYLDQVAFSFLMALYSLFGVSDIPKEPSPDWTVVERWAEQPGRTYRLVLESTVVPEKCARNPELKYLIFPQVYFSQQEVYVDDRLLFTNSLSSKWNLTNSFDRAILRCDQVANAKKIRFVGESYVIFFASIGIYPYFADGFPKGQFFFHEINLVAGGICLLLGILGVILMWGLESRSTIFYFFLQELFFFIFMYSYAGGLVIEMPISVQHGFIFLGFSSGFFLFMSQGLEILQKKYVRAVVLCILFLISAFGYGYRNIIQSGIEILAAVYLTSITYIFFQKSRMRTMSVESFVYLLVVIFGAKDVYVSYFTRTGASHLSFLVMIVSVANFLKVIERINFKKSEAFNLGVKLNAERAVLSKINSINEQYREILHDLKSPISAMNFMLRGSSFTAEGLGQIVTRVSDILVRIEDSGYKKTFGWYSIPFCKDSIFQVLVEKNLGDLGEIRERFGAGTKAIDVYIDPVDFKVVIAELLDNSTKAGSTNFIFEVYADSVDEVKICYFDNGKGLSIKQLEASDGRGISQTGSGMGLYGVKNKIESWRGEFKIVDTQKGFRCEITITARLD